MEIIITKVHQDMIFLDVNREDIRDYSKIKI